MKTFASLLFAAGVASTAYADHGIHARHQDLHERQLPAYMGKPHPPPPGQTAPDCGCYSYTTTWYGAPTLIPDLRKYTSTTSDGWETIAPVETGTPSSSEKEPVATTTSFQPRRKNSSSTLSKVSSSSSSTCTDEATSSPSPPSYAKKTPVSSSTTPVVSSSTVEVKQYVAASSMAATSSYMSFSTYASPSSKAPHSSSIASYSSEIASYSSSTTSSSASPSATANNTISPNGDKWAFCYTPFADNGDCKTAEAVNKDIADIKAKGFTTVRLYATDCEGPQNVGAAAAEHGMKMILGIYVDETGIGSNTDAQVATLTKWGSDKWDLVEMVVAGNEAMFYGYTTAEGLAGFVNDVRSKFRAAGYQGPVGTSEVPGTFTTYADILCPAVDYAAANIHPFFNAEVAAKDAGDFVATQLDTIAKACGYKKEAYNLESGWPSLGSANGLAVPSVEDQKTAIASIMEKAGNKTAMFSYENDSWKAPGEHGVEQYWGCGSLFE
jgi:exo-beta-1,3-glucanase (GH17 family)